MKILERISELLNLDSNGKNEENGDENNSTIFRKKRERIMILADENSHPEENKEKQDGELSSKTSNELPYLKQHFHEVILNLRKSNNNNFPESDDIYYKNCTAKQLTIALGITLCSWIPPWYAFRNSVRRAGLKFGIFGFTVGSIGLFNLFFLNCVNKHIYCKDCEWASKTRCFLSSVENYDDFDESKIRRLMKEFYEHNKEIYEHDVSSRS